MIRLAVFGILIIFIILLVRSYFSSASEEEGKRLSMEMVQDPNCETYIPKSEAVVKTLSGETLYFCGEKCAREFEEKARQG
ncbi:MAG: hypothetical protein VYC17_06315 [Nitrospinota bacterium]|nr:hypothetical protein [Nitrospinota bacterium]